MTNLEKAEAHLVLILKKNQTENTRSARYCGRNSKLKYQLSNLS